MKNKKGFTLIELLAVIVILAIIALIAVPIVLNMINQSRKSAARSSALGYIDSIEYYSGFNLISDEAGITGYSIPLPEMTNGTVTCTKTTSGWDSNCSAFFTAVDAKAKGDKPKTATIILSSKGEVLEGTTMKFGKYIVDYDGENATVGGSSSSSNNDSSSGNTTSTTRTCEQYATDSWSTIASNKYPVGCDGKTITMDLDNDGTDETYHVMTVNNTDCTNKSSETACGMVYQFKELLKISSDDSKMNLERTTVGGWPATRMRTFLNETVYNQLPSDLRSVIKTTKVVSGQEIDVADNYISYDKLYLLSTVEAGTSADEDKAGSPSITRSLDYYRQNSKKKYKYGTSTAIAWWLRTANSENNIAFCDIKSVGYIGVAGYANDTYYGVAPAFRLGTN